MPKHEDEVELAASVDGLARSRFWLEAVKISDELAHASNPEKPLTALQLSGIILKLANEVLLIRPARSASASELLRAKPICQPCIEDRHHECEGCPCTARYNGKNHVDNDRSTT